jgi:hypothetical protein
LWGRSLKHNNHTLKISLTHCTTPNDSTCKRTKQMTPGMIGWISGLANPSLTFHSSFIFNGGLCNSTLNSPKFWKLKLNKLKNAKQMLLHLPADLWTTLLSKFQKWHVHNFFKIEACMKFVPYTSIYACGKNILIGQSCWLSCWKVWYSSDLEILPFLFKALGEFVLIKML